MPGYVKNISKRNYLFEFLQDTKITKNGVTLQWLRCNGFVAVDFASLIQPCL